MIRQIQCSAMLLIMLLAGAARADAGETEDLRKLCMRAYLNSVVPEDWNSYAARSRESCRGCIERRAKLADDIKAIIKKIPEGTPGLAEAKSIFVHADSAAQEYTRVLESNVIPENGRIEGEENWRKVRPMLLRASNHEIAIENIVMKWTYELLGQTFFYVPRQPYPLNRE